MTIIFAIVILGLIINALSQFKGNYPDAEFMRKVEENKKNEETKKNKF